MYYTWRHCFTSQGGKLKNSMSRYPMAHKQRKENPTSGNKHYSQLHNVSLKLREQRLHICLCTGVCNAYCHSHTLLYNNCINVIIVYDCLWFYVCFTVISVTEQQFLHRFHVQVTFSVLVHRCQCASRFSARQPTRHHHQTFWAAYTLAGPYTDRNIVR